MRDLLAYINSIDDQYKTPLWQVMEANYTFNLAIEEFARIAQRSVATFKREFHEYYHTTPGKWLTQKRLEYAKDLLDTSKKNVSEIADESGFENITHFSRIFKEKYGLSPLQYRKKTMTSFAKNRNYKFSSLRKRKIFERLSKMNRCCSK